ncbi:MAG: T9SS type A sorting domain-containing protein [Bacteroidetes bacterium]|nr:T9SS type A sorting domain-containing protein [Bacteroidota bacterium]
MKKLLLLTFVILFAKLGSAQITLLSQDFNSYDGDSANFLSGYYVSWNSPSGGMPSASYYSSTGNFGIAPNSYKFGVDSATIITPYFGSGADRVSFWYKGNGTGTGANIFYVYESADSITFTLLDSITSFPTLGTQRILTNTAGTHYLKFVYHKVVGNVAFDDLVVSNNMGVGIANYTENTLLKVSPNPSSTGIFALDFGSEKPQQSSVKVHDILGNLVAFTFEYSATGKLLLNLSEQAPGYYFVAISSSTGTKNSRLLVTN